MNASEMKKGDMFFYIPDNDFQKPEVFIKIEDTTIQGYDVSVFVKNSPIVRYIFDENYVIGGTDRWAMTDSYFRMLMQKGCIHPIEDMRETEALCKLYHCEYEFV